MTGLELRLSKAEQEQVEYNSIKKLKGARFGIDSIIDKCSVKSKEEEVFNAFKCWLNIDQAGHEKLKSGCPDDIAASFASYVGALMALRHLPEEESKDSFFSSTKVDLRDSHPIPVNNMLEIYGRAVRTFTPAFTLEQVTSSYFEWICSTTASFLEEREATLLLEKVIIDGEEIKIDFQQHRKGNGKKASPTIDVTKYLVEKADKAPENLSDADFIYGQEHVKKEFAKITTIVKYKEYFTGLFDPKRLFNHYLLVGPPGTGKTTLIRSLSSRCGMYFYNIPCVELGSEYFTKTATNIHNVYREARKMVQEQKTPGVIIFFDEIDHIAKKRGRDNSREYDSLVTTLNENMDGSSSSPGIITFAATNVEEMLDTAIANRFKRLYVGYPADDKGVIGIHQAVIRKMEQYAHRKLFDSLEYSRILSFAHKEERYKSGREIERILRNVAIEKSLPLAGTGKYPLVTTTDLVAAYDHHEFEQQNTQNLAEPGVFIRTR